MIKISVKLLLVLLLFIGCQPKEQVLTTTERELLYIEKEELPPFASTQSVYVPAYSNLYHMEGSRKSYFTVVLSLRNISFTDTVYFTKVDYHDSRGKKIRQYIDKPLVLRPMESAEYIIEQTEDQGGAGANFIVDYKTNALIRNKPIIQAVMVGSIGHYGFSFKVDGVDIK